MIGIIGLGRTEGRLRSLFGLSMGGGGGAIYSRAIHPKKNSFILVRMSRWRRELPRLIMRMMHLRHGSRERLSTTRQRSSLRHERTRLTPNPFGGEPGVNSNSRCCAKEVTDTPLEPKKSCVFYQGAQHLQNA